MEVVPTALLDVSLNAKIRILKQITTGSMNFDSKSGC